MPKSTYVDKHVGQKYVRNVNRRGVDAWPYREETDFLRPFTQAQHVFSLKRPSLSYDKKAVFHLGSYRGLESK